MIGKETAFLRHAVCALGLLSCLITLSVRAAPCSAPIDLRDRLLAGLPSGEQGDSYACGFFAAATELDAFRRLSGAEERAHLPVDPIALAIDLAIAKNRPRWLPFQMTSDPLSVAPGRRGSLVCDILDYARDRGVCDPGDPRVLDREWMRKRSNQALALYALLDAFADDSDATRRSKLAAVVAAIRDLIAETNPSPTAEEVSRIVWLNREWPYRSIRIFLYPNCVDETSVRRSFADLPDCRRRWFTGTSGARRAIDGLLERTDALPVTTLLCFQVFREGRNYKGSLPWSEDCILHYVNAIGRREKAGVCQFLVRNSYDPSDEYAISKDWEREGPDLWIDADLFSRSAYGVLDLRR